MAARHELFATCPRGLEPVLHQELKELRMGRIERQVGGCRFQGGPMEVARANLWLRTANRVLLRVDRFPCPGDAALYEAAREVPWERWLRPEGTLRVQARVQDSALTHGRYVEQRVKDAVCDRFVERTGARPSVGDEESDLRIHVHLFRDRATLALDTTGAPLYKRGWRVAQGRAPLPETLAAGLVLLSGWDRRSPVLDPFCGSGTLLVEAALLAAGAAPGLGRAFGAERWLTHEPRLWERARREAEQARRPTPKLQLVGSDLHAERVEDTRANLEAAGVSASVHLDAADGRSFAPRPGWNGQVLTNLPWGVRVSDPARVVALYEAFGSRLRERAAGYALSLLGGEPRQLDALGIAGERTELANGNQPCVLLRAALA